MLGAIIGDIIGSYYEVLEINAKKISPDKKRQYEERISILNKDIALFNSECSYTDDSVLTLAIASALLSDKDYESSLRKYGNKELNMGVDKYGRSRFGKNFVSWVKKEKIGDSFGNGGAMRVSPIGFYFDRLEDVLKEAKSATIPSHNTDEAITGAQAVATAIYLARKGHSKKDIKDLITFYFEYDLNFSLEELSNNYQFSASTHNSVPQAIYCFLESDSFEDAIRKSISIGGDSDTIAAIVGSISEAFYGIPEELKKEALTYLLPEYKSIVNDFYEELQLRSALKQVGIDDDNFIAYMRTRIKKYDIGHKSDIWGYFADYDENGILTNIRLIVPRIIDEKTLLINIHEYTHAYDAYLNLGTSYVENKDKNEARAKNNEAKFLEKKKLYEHIS